jgi:hypothetical protein
MAHAGKPFQVFQEKQIAEIIFRVQELIKSEVVMGQDYLKGIECENLKALKWPVKNIIIQVLFQQLFAHTFTKEVMLKELFSQKLEIGIFKTLMQSLYLTIAIKFDPNHLRWLDCLSEAFFIKS